MQHRILKPRFVEYFFARKGYRYFYRTIGKKQIQMLSEPFLKWRVAEAFGENKAVSLVNLGWTQYTLEQFKEKFQNIPFFLDDEQKKQYIKDKKIKSYLIKKQKIMNSGLNY